MSEPTPVPAVIAADSRFQAANEARSLAAERAKLHQAKYKSLNASLIIATAVSAIVGGLILYGIDTAPEDIPNSPILKQWVAQNTVQLVLGLVQALALGTAAYCGSCSR